MLLCGGVVNVLAYRIQSYSFRKGNAGWLIPSGFSYCISSSKTRHTQYFIFSLKTGTYLRIRIGSGFIISVSVWGGVYGEEEGCDFIPVRSD